MINQLIDTVKQTPLGEILVKFDYQRDELFEKYLMDFVHICQVGTDSFSMEGNFYEVGSVTQF